METVGSFEAKTLFSRRLDRVARGEEIAITTFRFRTFPRSWISMWYRDPLAPRGYPGRCSTTRTPRHKEAARAAYTRLRFAPTPVPVRLHRADLRHLPPHRHRLVPLAPAPLRH